ncbi:MAG TPA: acyl-CoA dehydrogenase [Deltaproteobacteria bacterium]|nr:acyl-CoA dehydrogenase [Deltaproteobacteria bacterium]
MLTRGEVSALIQRFPKVEDTLLSLQYAPKMPKGMVQETKAAIALARKFNNEVARPLALKLDRKTHEDPDYLPWELVETANRWGFYTRWIPRMLGGWGLNMPSMSYFTEELASVCLGITNVIGVHYLGIAGITACGNLKVAKRVLSEVVEGEKTGTPCIVSLSITEPSAGTDVEETDLMDKGTVTCHAERVKGGYVFNGRKIFISMGHVSTWTVVFGYTDLKRPSETAVAAVVKTGSPGFSFGSHENKMGQRVCPASELIFEDCFVPDNLILMDAEKARKYTGKPIREVTQRYTDYVVSATRAGVGAMGAGAARGAFEHAMQYASETFISGKPLIHYEWVQCLLAEMYKNAMLARLTYIEANYANSLRGMYKILQLKPFYYYYKHVPQAYNDKVLSPLTEKDWMTSLMIRTNLDWQFQSDQNCTSGWASLAKFSGTDLGMKNCQLALELMGQTGLRQERWVEKMLRDIKLCQIYEGTNQLNRVNLFKCLIGPAHPQVRVFDEQG